MQLVVEGTAQFRRIISVGIDGHVYILGPDQAIRTVADWGGRRKSECHWDETNQVIVDKPYPLTPEELAAKDKPTMAEEIEALKRHLDELECRTATPVEPK